MTLLLQAAQMRAIDRAAIDGLGLPGVVLMENAGRGVVDVILRARPGLIRGGVVTVVAGAGQNGGDGFVIARLLAAVGARVKVLLVAPPARIAGDARTFLQVIERMGDVAIVDRSAAEDDGEWRADLAGSDVLVDAIYGTGLRADVTGSAAAAIRAMNDTTATNALRVAVDLPSGLSADDGVVRGVAFVADVTCTMGAPKLGLWLNEAAPVGQIEVVSLGFDLNAHRAAAAAVGPLCHLLDAPTVRQWLPRAARAAHKGARGHVLVVAGSAGKTGAALLAATAAMRAGAGLCSVATTAAGQAALDAKTWEVMTTVYARGDDADASSEAHLMGLVPRMKAAALGPGIPTGSGMKALVAKLATALPLPLVIDADGLSLLGTDAAALLANAAFPRVLTPHPVEMARLTGLSVAQIAADRVGVARTLATRSGAVVILKGARTVVAAPDGQAYINPTADAALATAGSGDVLTGVIAAFLAQGVAPCDAACAAVFVHGEAAATARRTLGTGLLVAGDLPIAVARTIEALWSPPPMVNCGP